MAIITQALLNALRAGFRADFEAGKSMAPSVYTQIASVIPSTTESNTYGWLGDFPNMREWIGDRVLKDMKEQAYAISNKLWESTVAVQRTKIEDDNLGLYKPLMQEAGRVASEHPDKLVFNLIKAGGATLCYDGQFFFDTDHPVYANVDGTGTVSTVSNIQPGAGVGAAWYLLDTSRAIKPVIFQDRLSAEFDMIDDTKNDQVFMKDNYLYGVRARNNVGFSFWQLAYKSTQDLTEANFNAAYAAMMGTQADGGKPMGVRPTLLVTVPENREKALKITKAEYRTGGESNINSGVVQTLITPWLL